MLPIIRLSDQTHLTNFSGDKKAWPVYMLIGNILLRTRSSPAKMAMVLLALLPVPLKFTGESALADESQRQTNADFLRAVFDLVLAPLHQVAQDGTEMYCEEGKTQVDFSILSAGIADHAEHPALQRIGSKSDPKCEVLCEKVGGDLRQMYKTCDHILYREKGLRHQPAEAAGIAEYFPGMHVKIEKNVFTGLDQVSPTDLHKPVLLHNIYIGLSKHMMEWVEGFLKKYKQ